MKYKEQKYGLNPYNLHIQKSKSASTSYDNTVFYKSWALSGWGDCSVHLQTSRRILDLYQLHYMTHYLSYEDQISLTWCHVSPVGKSSLDSKRKLCDFNLFSYFYQLLLRMFVLHSKKIKKKKEKKKKIPL
jgi:hypothetical protein